MLLPSALSCDIRGPLARSRFSASRLFSTPPPDDRLPSGNGLLGTCRALQSLLNGSPAPSARRTPKPDRRRRLQSPFEQSSPPPSSSLSSWSSIDPPRSTTSPSPPTSASKAKSRSKSKWSATPLDPRPPPPARPRGANKRRREACEADNGGRNDACASGSRSYCECDRECSRFCTPKRQRRLPYDLPLGLTESDFYALHSPPGTLSTTPSPPPAASRRQRQEQEPQPPLSPIDPDAALPSMEELQLQLQPPPGQASSLHHAAAPADWTAEDDQRLVELVLEKFKLTKRDWEECARRMGKDDASVGRRWHALVGEGNVGLRRGRRVVRGRIDDRWREDC